MSAINIRVLPLITFIAFEPTLYALVTTSTVYEQSGDTGKDVHYILLLCCGKCWEWAFKCYDMWMYMGACSIKTNGNNNRKQTPPRKISD